MKLKNLFLSVALAAVSVATSFASDLSISAGSVLASQQAVVRSGTAGAEIIQGKTVFLDSSDGFIKLASASDTETKAVIGIALNHAYSGQPVDYAISDSSFTVGAAISIGKVYCLSATTGGIAPGADMEVTTGSGTFLQVLGVPISTTKLNLKIVRGDVVSP